MDNKLLISIDEAQKILGVGRSKMYELAHADGFPVVIIGRRLYVHLQKLTEWADSQCGSLKDQQDQQLR